MFIFVNLINSLNIFWGDSMMIHSCDRLWNPIKILYVYVPTYYRGMYVLFLRSFFTSEVPNIFLIDWLSSRYQQGFKTVRKSLRSNGTIGSSIINPNTFIIFTYSIVHSLSYIFFYSEVKVPIRLEIQKLKVLSHKYGDYI